MTNIQECVRRERISESRPVTF